MRKEISGKEVIDAYLNGNNTVRVVYENQIDSMPLQYLKKLIDSGTAKFTIEVDPDFELPGVEDDISEIIN